MCHWISKDHAFCEADPVSIEVDSDRGSCRFFKCAGCGLDEEEDADHSLCMDDAVGLILVR